MMSQRATQVIKGIGLVFLTLLAWVLFSLTVGHSWHRETAVGVTVEGATGLWALEALANLPDLLYFLTVGAALFYFSGPVRTIWWAVAAGAIAMPIKTVARNYTFPQGVSWTDAGVLFVDLVMPLLFAIAGAAVARRLIGLGHGADNAA
jgi:hypothetical protein